MEQRSNDAAVKDAPIKLRMEEYALALGMVQRSSYADAAVKDAQIVLSEEDCV